MFAGGGECDLGVVNVLPGTFIAVGEDDHQFGLGLAGVEGVEFGAHKKAKAEAEMLKN